MTIEERYELSCYQELTKLDDSKNIWLVRHNESGMIYIKKELQWFNRDIYRRLQNADLPNIPKIKLCICEESVLTVIEEYIHGMTLEQFMEQNGIFSEEKAVNIALAICDILEPLHTSQPPIVHRDIKPSNIMISNDGIIKLIDFNAAKEFNLTHSEDTRLMGTKKFAAPEQYGFGQSDPRTDIYALGVTIYYLLTKNYPDSGGYYGKLNPIIQKCIHLDKTERYQDIGQLRKELIAFAHQNSSTEMPSSSKNHVKHNLFTKQLYPCHEKLPVGFRTGTNWKIITATPGYLLIFWLCSTLTVTGSKGIPLSGFPLFVNRLGSFLMLMGTIFFIGNYCHIRNRLPLINRSRLLHLVFSIIYLLIYYILILSLVTLLGGA